ncbi:MAG: S-layer homology domain-containing protein [Oscillospiraceae bacterium]|nr:S-layer homology domain-containing protein [Oscillospiraceae bacterium]
MAVVVLSAFLPAKMDAEKMPAAEPMQAASEPIIETERHEAYLTAEEFFRPDAAITRAEAAQIFYRTLTLPPTVAVFTDVPEESEYAEAIEATAGLFAGYEDGTFGPDQTMTKAEFVTILSRQFGVLGTSETFADVQEADWYFPHIAAAQEQGWLDGQPTDRFRPREPITRAELVMILNRALGRTADTEAEVPDYYLDIYPEHMAYHDALEATLSHEYILEEDGTETWQTEQLPQSTLTQGLHLDTQRAWYVDADGKVCRKAGILNVDGASYLVTKTGEIPADETLHLTDDGVVFCNADGTLLKNGTWNDFTFDANGYYTSGSDALDAFVDQALAACTTAQMTREEKLRACFDYVRAFRYLGRNAAIYDKTMPYDLATAWAEKIFETGKGDCYNFTAAFYFLARRLGYDATAVLGSCQYYWSGVPITHGWVEMQTSSGVRIYDPQIENYNDRSGISNDHCGAFGVSYEAASGRYYKN